MSLGPNLMKSSQAYFHTLVFSKSLAVTNEVIFNPQMLVSLSNVHLKVKTRMRRLNFTTLVTISDLGKILIHKLVKRS